MKSLSSGFLFVCLYVSAFLVPATVLPAATYLLNEDGTVTKQDDNTKAKACSCGCESGKPCECDKCALPFVEATADIVCNALGCYEVSSPGGTRVSSSTSYETSSSSCASGTVVQGRQAVFPRLAARRESRGKAAIFTMPAPATMSYVPVETVPMAIMPPPPPPVALAAPTAEPAKFMMVGRHHIAAADVEKLKAAGFTWADILRLVLKYGPMIIQDLLNRG